MPKDTAIALLQNFVRENLEIGWSHLEDGRLAEAKHHFARALEQVNEIETLCSGASMTAAPNACSAAADQPTLDI